jgi:hypothetical protein
MITDEPSIKTVLAMDMYSVKKFISNVEKKIENQKDTQLPMQSKDVTEKQINELESICSDLSIIFNTQELAIEKESKTKSEKLELKRLLQEFRASTISIKNIIEKYIKQRTTS